MFEIVYFGNTSFRFAGKEASVATDIFELELEGFKLPKIEADFVTISGNQKRIPNSSRIDGDYICFDSPGEYEIKSVEILGMKSLSSATENQDKGNIIFVYDIDDYRICHLGGSVSELSSEQVEKINGVDILILPIGEKYGVNPKEAVRTISLIGPKVVIPAYSIFATKKGDSAIEDFTREMGVTAKKMDELRMRGKDFGEGTQVYLLEPKAK